MLVARKKLKSMQAFLMKYGLIAVFVSAMAEADVVPVLTGVVAHLGYFGFVPSIGIASLGAFVGDCVWFVLGRTRSKWIRNSRIYARAGKIRENLDRQFGVWQIPASHIIYGTRIATMIVSGVGELSFAKFALMDILGCVAFTSLLATLGFLFSTSASLIIGHVRRVELFLLMATILFTLVFRLVKVLAQRHTASSEKDFKRA
jgi:membrane protein DedA with SNARE-associated domain